MCFIASSLLPESLLAFLVVPVDAVDHAVSDVPLLLLAPNLQLLALLLWTLLLLASLQLLALL
jgi:hypothetical protein